MIWKNARSHVSHPGCDIILKLLKNKHLEATSCNAELLETVPQKTDFVST